MAPTQSDMDLPGQHSAKDGIFCPHAAERSSCSTLTAEPEASSCVFKLSSSPTFTSPLSKSMRSLNFSGLAFKTPLATDHDEAGSALNSLHSHTLSSVSEDMPWEETTCAQDELELDNLSAILSSSESEDETSSDAIGPAISQGRRVGPLDNLNSIEAALPVKRGLSRFYSGRSRSFSCLADALTSKELGKPENSYTRKRKYLQKTQGGSYGISKKLHNTKCSLALAVALSTDEGTSLGKWQSRSAPSRSYSLSDLQAAGSQ